MKTISKIFVIVVILGFVFGLVSAREAKASTLDVCASGCTYSSIQDAVNVAVSGDVISIRAGLYEGFSIVGKSNITISGAGKGQTLIEPTSLINTGVGHKYVTPTLASVFVNQSSDVTIEGLTVKSTSATPGSGGADAIVFWNASTGTIKDSSIEGIYTISGNQTGQGLAVDAGAGETASLALVNTDISGSQKNAIDVVDGNASTPNAGTISLSITGGSFTGAGPTSTNAQNGIMAWNRGGGSIDLSVSGATISGFDYTPTDNEATGILVYGVGGGTVSVSGNTLTGNEINIYDNTTSLDMGAIFTANTFGPVALIPGGNSILGTIQGAINEATDGDTINIYGTHVLSSMVNVDKAVTLSCDPGALIQVSGAGDGFDFSADGASLVGCQIEKTDKTGEQNIIRIRASDITIQKNKIWGRYVIGDGDVSRAMIIYSGAFTNLLIDQNEIYDLRQPAYISGTHSGTISNNYVHNTRGWVLEGGNLTFSNNTWAGNVLDVAILSSMPAAYYPDIVAMSNANNGAVIEDQRNSPALLSVVYVDDDAPAGGNGGQEAPYQTIQAGVNRVTPGGTVHVAAGTYLEKNILLNKSLTLLGDPGDAAAGPGVNAPLVDGGGAYGDAFKLANGVTNVTIKGFEVANFATDDYDGVGNAVSAWVGSTSNITIQDNYFHDLEYNGVLVGNDYSSNPARWGDHTNWLIKGNIVEDFGFVGFELTNTSNSTVEGNIIHMSSPYIGAFFSSARRSESGLTIKDNYIDGTPSNVFPIIYLYAYDLEMTAPNLNNVTLTGNTIAASAAAPFQVYIRNIGTGTITNVVMEGNKLRSVKNLTGQNIDASPNWWGTRIESLITPNISGDVTYKPYFIDEALTMLSEPLPNEVWVDDDYTYSPEDCGPHLCGFDGFMTIQEAINGVAAGGTVHVADGSYYPPAVINVNKAMSILGPASGEAKVYGVGGSTVKVFEITSSDVTISKLTITLANAPSAHIGMINVPDGPRSNINITDNKIYVDPQPGAMSTWYGQAVYLGRYITGSNVSGNTIYNTRGGIVVHYNSALTISNNVIYNTKGGIMNYTGTQADADARVMTGNSWNGIHNEWDIVWNTGGGPYAMDMNKSVLQVSQANNDGYTISLMTTGPLSELKGNRSHVFVDDDSSFATAHQSRGNLNEPFKHMQLGIDAVVPGGTVYVAAGNYNEAVTANKALKLIGAGKETTIVDGTGLSNATLFSSAGLSSGVLDISGFTFKDDPNPNAAMTYLVSFGGCQSPAAVSFTDNTVLGTGDTDKDWGLLAQHGTCSFTINDNLFDNIGGNSIMVENSTGAVEIGDNEFLVPNDGGPAIWSMAYGSSSVPNTVTGLHWYHDNYIHPKAAGGSIWSGITIAPAWGSGWNVRQYGSYTNALIEKNKVEGFQSVGIQVEVDGTNSTFNGVIQNNTLTATPNVSFSKGIRLLGSVSNTTLRKNIVTNAYRGIWLSGTWGQPVYPTGITSEKNQLADNDIGYEEQDTASDQNASPNWWGSASGPAAGYVVSNLKYAPWCTNPECTAFYGPVHNVTQDTYFGSIQDAIDDPATVDGDVITAEAGTYTGPITVNKSVSLLGPNALIDPNTGTREPESVLQGTTTSGLSQFVNIEAENVVIKGFTFDNLRIDNYNSSTQESINGDVIENNIFTNISGTAIYLRDGRNAPGEYSTGVVVSKNKINPTTSAGSADYNAGTGIVIYGAEDSTISGNSILSAAYNGIQLARCKEMTLSGNIVTGAVEPALQIAQWNAGTFAISGNTFSTTSSSKAAVRMYAFTNNYYPLFNFSGNTIKDSKYGVQIGHGKPGQSYNDIRDADYSFSGNTFTNISTHRLIIYLPAAATGAEKAEMDAMFAQLYGAGNQAMAITAADPFTYVIATCTTDCYVDPTGDDLNPGTESAPFLTIQKGINAVTPGGTVHVGAGTYVENVVVNKSVTIDGAGAGTIVMPAVSNPGVGLPGSLGGSNVFLVKAHNVKITDLVIDGDNPALVSGVVVGGADLDARNGIITDHTAGVFTGFEVSYVTVKNIYLRGIYASSASSGATFNIHHNNVSNTQGTGQSFAIMVYNGTGTVADNVIDYGKAVGANYSQGTQWLRNILTHTPGGIHTDNAGYPNILGPEVISGNNVDCDNQASGYGIWTFVNHMPITVENNTVTGCGVAYSAWGSGNTSVATFQNNSATAPVPNNNSVGAYITTSGLGWGYYNVNANFTGNTLTGFATGVILSAGPASWEPTPYVAKTITSDIKRNNIVGSTQYAVYQGAQGIYAANLKENWWGSLLGPQAPITDNVDVIQWCGTANPTCLPLMPQNGNNLSLSGTVNLETNGLYVPGITVLLTDGTTIQNTDEACFNVFADHISIMAESKLGAKCVPAAGKNGVNVAAGLQDVNIANLEFDGSAGGVRGVLFSGVVDYLTILDNWFHGLTGDAIEFQDQPTGIISIQGNLFQENDGRGIQSYGAIIPAEFNAWGDIDGPVAGDGVSAGVDADPWTHVDLYLYSTSPASIGGQVTYTVYGNLANVMGAGFTLAYPAAKLQLVSGSLTNLSGFVEVAPGAGVFDTSTAGEIRFTGKVPAATPISGKSLPIYSVTFTVLGDDALLDLVEAGAEFTMAPVTADPTWNPAYSTNIYHMGFLDALVTTNSYTVQGTLTMEYRYMNVRSGIPGTMTGNTYGLYMANSVQPIPYNMKFLNVAAGTYTFTTNQPRYLNITADLAKTITVVNSNVTFSAPLTLIAGNANWSDNVIDIVDASLVGNKYGWNVGTQGDTDADVDFSLKVGLSDLAIVGSNYGKSSAVNYTWMP